MTVMKLSTEANNAIHGRILFLSCSINQAHFVPSAFQPEIGTATLSNSRAGALRSHSHRRGKIQVRRGLSTKHHWANNCVFPRKIVSEIDQIRSGLWDDKIRAKLAGISLAEETHISETIKSPDRQGSDVSSLSYIVPSAKVPKETKPRVQSLRMNILVRTLVELPILAPSHHSGRCVFTIRIALLLS
jgi:hypothetical protein